MIQAQVIRLAGEYAIIQVVSAKKTLLIRRSLADFRSFHEKFIEASVISKCTKVVGELYEHDGQTFSIPVLPIAGVLETFANYIDRTISLPQDVYLVPKFNAEFNAVRMLVH
jgi:hypothetical protein